MDKGAKHHEEIEGNYAELGGRSRVRIGGERKGGGKSRGRLRGARISWATLNGEGDTKSSVRKAICYKCSLVIVIFQRLKGTGWVSWNHSLSHNGVSEQPKEGRREKKPKVGFGQTNPVWVGEVAKDEALNEMHKFKGGEG